MTKERLIILCYFHLGVSIKNEEQVLNAVSAIDVASSLSPFEDASDLNVFMSHMFFPDGVPEEHQKMVATCANKWFWWFPQEEEDRK